MRLPSGLLIVLAALLAALLGLAASVAVYGPGPLLASPLGQWIDRAWPASADRRLALGDTVQDWSLPRLHGGISRLPVSGQPTLINYWASWCGPCREELPLLAGLARDPQAGLAVRAIALDSAEEANRFLTAEGLHLPVALEAPGPDDSSVRLGNRAGVLPFSVLIDGQGRLRARKTGAFRSRADLRDWIEQGLAPP